jgi:glucokinase
MYYIGIDLGGTNIAAGLVDESGKIIHKDSIPTKRERESQEIIKDMRFLR